MSLRAAALILLSLAAAPAAGGMLLGLPIECRLGETCFIQNYVDRDPGPGAADFTCGPLSYDGHKGTDFALPSRAAMAAGVNVLAAAPGTVSATRDGMPDTGPEAPPPDGRDCGNGVVIDHGGGWQTQYCHLARGSVAVRPGQRVRKGTPLGRVGLSGRTEFPHLHLSVRHDGQIVDPFATGGQITCKDPAQRTIWQHPPDYRPGGLIGIGFAEAVPDYDAVKAGMPPMEVTSPQTGALVVWAHLYGARAGDTLNIALIGPYGPLDDHGFTLDKTQARLFRAFGKKRPRGGWPTGAYRAEVELLRDGARLQRQMRTLRVE